MSEKPTHIPDTAVCFWQDKGTWLCAFKDYKPGDPVGRGADFEIALRSLHVNKKLLDYFTPAREQPCPT